MTDISGMNKTESSYAGYLRLRKLAGEIVEYRFEALKLRLASATFYTPDFLVITPDRVELHEVKGFWEDDARVKWKTAAEQFPWFIFVAVTRPKGRGRAGGWDFEYYPHPRPVRP